MAIFALFVYFFITIGLALIVGWACKIWPVTLLTDSTEPKSTNEPRGVRAALVVCLMITVYAAASLTKVVVLNRQAGGILPLPQRPPTANSKWRHPVHSETQFRRHNDIPMERALTEPELREFNEIGDRVRREEDLRDWTESALKLYILIPFSFFWLLALSFSKTRSKPLRISTIPLLVALTISFYQLSSLQVFTALSGD
jgi:hypothetical protein